MHAANGFHAPARLLAANWLQENLRSCSLRDWNSKTFVCLIRCTYVEQHHTLIRQSFAAEVHNFVAILTAFRQARKKLGAWVSESWTRICVLVTLCSKLRLEKRAGPDLIQKIHENQALLPFSARLKQKNTTHSAQSISANEVSRIWKQAHSQEVCM